jgi:hypothetical protein
MKFFHGKKGTLLPEKGHLPKLGGGGAVPTPLFSIHDLAHHIWNIKSYFSGLLSPCSPKK